MSSSNVNRDQIAKAFGGDPRLIRQFELMAQQSSATPAQLLDVALSADSANSKAAAALGLAARLASELEQAVGEAVSASARANSARASIQRLADDAAVSLIAPISQPIPGIGQLRNVHAPAPSNGHVLIYDSIQNRWESATITAGANITITNSAGGITIAAASTTGASGSFLSADAKTITVVDGLITSIV